MSVVNLALADCERTKVATQICVIGGGMAGLLAACRLAQNGHRVIVVESGEEQLDPAVQGLSEIDDPSGRYVRAMTGRYRGLGGSSSQWGGRTIPLRDEDTGERSYIGQAAWPFDVAKLQPYREQIERLFGLSSDNFEDIPMPAWQRILAGGASSLTPRWAKCAAFRKRNVAALLKKELKRKTGIEIWLGATVCSLETDREIGRLQVVVARSVNGKTLEVRADQFILAAGTIETTRLLLQLDAQADDQVFARCNALGRYFQDHLEMQVADIDRSDPAATNGLFAFRWVHATRRDLHLELSVAAQQSDRVASAYFFVSMDMNGSPLSEMRRVASAFQRGVVRPSDLKGLASGLGFAARTGLSYARHRQLYVPADVGFQLNVRIEQLPDETNRISLSRIRDRLGSPMASFSWRPTIRDENCMRSAVNNLDRYWKTTRLQELCPLIWRPGVQNARANLVDSAVDCAHPSGSTRMGTNLRESVVGPDLRCHLVPNVAIASASVFPTAGSSNPTFMILKLALWLADSYGVRN